MLVTVCGRNPAPPQKPWNDDPPVNANKPWFPVVAKWCEMDFATIHSIIRANLERVPEALSSTHATCRPWIFLRATTMASSSWVVCPLLRQAGNGQILVRSRKFQSDSAFRFMRVLHQVEVPSRSLGFHNSAAFSRAW